MHHSLSFPSLVAKISLVFACLTIGVLTAQAKPALPSQQLPAITLRLGMHLIQAEEAKNQHEHAIGLMGREYLAPNAGMLFIFPHKTKQCFWMKNTLIPLQIAFIADNGSIVNLHEMLPQTENSHCSLEPVRYVLEMNSNWFSKRGIKAGFKIAEGPWGRP